ncbi:MAG TPA: AAA family ATPase, partial [Chloroflexota bacterium]
MGQLSMALLGQPEVRRRGQPLALPTRKTQALLVYLAVEGGLHSRDKLTALLWPESDQAHGRRSLRSALVFLRRALGGTEEGGDLPVLTASREVVGIGPGSDLDLDVAALEEAFGTARRPADPAPAESLARLRRGATAYRGDFLDGFSLGDAAAFDEWVGAQREIWHRRADAVFDRLSRELADGGELAEALEVTERWSAIAPLNEEARRRLMRLRFANGDRAGALRAYEACRAILAEHLNAEPAPETEALARRLRSEPPPSEPSPDEPSIPLLSVDGPLVGRRAEHGELAAAYRSARRGRPQAVAIEGEAGIGKSRLASAFLAWAAAQGADVLRARAFETSARLPYQPLADALRPRLERENAPDDLLGDAWLAELGRLLPELRDRYPDLPPPALDEATARTRLFGAIARLVGALAARAPVVLWLDDAQWADAASLDVLRYGAARWAGAGAGVLLLVCLRSEELATNPALDGWLAGLGRELPLRRVELGPLTREDTDRLLGAVAGGSAAVGGADRLRALGDWLFAETGGQPFFLVETLKSL